MSIDVSRQASGTRARVSEVDESFEAWPAAKRALLKKYAVDEALAAPAQDTSPVLSEADQAALESLRAEARSEGYEQGLTQGRAEAKRELVEHRARFDTLVRQLQKPVAELDSVVADQLVDLALQVGSTLFTAAINQQPERVREIVREAVQMLPVATNEVSVYVHPDDAALLAEDATTQSTWQIVEDANLERGGCRVTTTASDVDATVAGRMQALQEALLGGNG